MQDSLPRPQRTIFACLPHPSLCIESQVLSPLLFCMFPLVPAPKLCIVLAHNPLFLAFIFAGYIPLACMPITSLSWADYPSGSGSYVASSMQLFLVLFFNRKRVQE